MPIAKLMIGGNRKPSIPAGESGFARRLVLVPMDRTIREGDRDRELDEKLWHARSEIAGWMVQGAREYLEDGLGRFRSAGTRPEPTTWRPRTCFAHGPMRAWRLTRRPSRRIDG